MTSLQLEITTHEKRLVYDLMGKSQVKTDEPVEISPGVSVTYMGTRGFKALDEPEIIGLILTIGANLPPNVVASFIGNWLWSKLQGRTESLTIDRVEIELEEGKITRYIHERIERG